MSETMKRHFVTFLSPGTFVSEQNEASIASWDVEAAVSMARTIKQRYGATPYGFYFSTRSRGPDDLDSKVSATSNIYYLGGNVETKEEVFARNDPKESVLRSNMEINGFDRIIVNNNSWRFTAALRDTDVVLEFTP